jgi:hypothetical protein
MSVSRLRTSAIPLLHAQILFKNRTWRISGETDSLNQDFYAACQMRCIALDYKRKCELSKTEPDLRLLR